MTDLSDDPNDSSNVDPNSDNDPDDPTVLLIPDIVIEKAMVGSPVPAASGVDGNYQVVFDLTVSNQGNETLHDVSLLQNFESDWGGAFQGLVGTPVILSGATATDLPELTVGYDGRTGNSELIDNTLGNTNLLESWAELHHSSRG